MQDTITRVRYKCYADRVDLTGKDILSIASRESATGKSGSRADARRLFPFLAEPADMEVREFHVADVTAYGAEVADEVHEFLRAGQGLTRIKRLMLRDGEVIGLHLGRFTRTEERQIEAEFASKGSIQRILRAALLGLALGAVGGAAIGLAIGQPALGTAYGAAVGLVFGGPALYRWARNYGRRDCSGRQS